MFKTDRFELRLRIPDSNNFGGDLKSTQSKTNTDIYNEFDKQLGQLR